MIDVTGMPQTALVVGGGSDIARETLRLLAARRLCRVVLAGPRQATMAATAAELKDMGVELVETRLLDVTCLGALAPFVSEVKGILGEVDLVLMASGQLGTSKLAELGPEGTAATVAVNYSGPVALMGLLANLMAEQGAGRMVVISSVAGARARKDNFVYGSAKAGLDCFSLGLADALAGTGVTVTVVRPGFVRTKMTAGMKPALFALSATATARLIVRGVEKGRPVVWAPPVLGPVFGLLRLLPGPAWRRVQAMSGR